MQREYPLRNKFLRHALISCVTMPYPRQRRGFFLAWQTASFLGISAMIPKQISGSQRLYTILLASAKWLTIEHHFRDITKMVALLSYSHYRKYGGAFILGGLAPCLVVEQAFG